VLPPSSGPKNIDSENEGSTFLRNVGKHLPVYMVLHCRKQIILIVTAMTGLTSVPRGSEVIACFLLRKNTAVLMIGLSFKLSRLYIKCKKMVKAIRVAGREGP
jgi:hypothetical protein